MALRIGTAHCCSVPGQESYAVLGRAYGELQYAKYTATLYRQYIDTPYVNQQDNRMTPNTFEAYRITGKYDWVQFAAGYIAAIKPRNANEFISMSEQAGAPPGRERGMITAGVRFTPTQRSVFRSDQLLCPGHMEHFLHRRELHLAAHRQTRHSNCKRNLPSRTAWGGTNLIGTFGTRVGGAQASLSYDNAHCSGRRFPSRRSRRTSRAHTVPIPAICR